MLGVTVNSAAVLIGGLLGLIFHKILPKKLGDAVMTGVALCVMYIGISGTLDDCDGFFKGEKLLVMIFSVVLGAIIGALCNLDGLLSRFGAAIEKKFVKAGNGKTSFAGAFVSSTLLFCVGAMAVVGSLDAGISGDNSTLFAKSVLDGISAVVFASTLGAGVMLSAASLFVYQGAIVLLAQVVAPVLSITVITEMSVVGSLLIVALSLNMLKITNIKITNYLPAIFLPIGLCPLCEWIAGLI